MVQTSRQNSTDNRDRVPAECFAAETLQDLADDGGWGCADKPVGGTPDACYDIPGLRGRTDNTNRTRRS